MDRLNLVLERLMVLVAEDNKYNIPNDLLHRYVSTIKAMGLLRVGDASVYGHVEREREKIHSKILKHVGVGREDKKFALWLASYVDDILDQI